MLQGKNAGWQVKAAIQWLRLAALAAWQVLIDQPLPISQPVYICISNTWSYIWQHQGTRTSDTCMEAWYVDLFVTTEWQKNDTR